jgi:hypothetical protein
MSIYRRLHCARCGKRPIIEHKKRIHIIATKNKRNYFRVKCSCGYTTPWVYSIHHRDPIADAILLWNSANAAYINNVMMNYIIGGHDE